jgi:hypothetical protein
MEAAWHSRTTAEDEMRRLWVMKLTLVSCLLMACDQRTPEEKGKDYANEKLGFVEGAAQVLKEKGNSLGQTAGKGLTELVKGFGSGVKDVVNPPVNHHLSQAACATCNAQRCPMDPWAAVRGDAPSLTRRLPKCDPARCTS